MVTNVLIQSDFDYSCPTYGIFCKKAYKKEEQSVQNLCILVFSRTLIQIPQWRVETDDNKRTLYVTKNESMFSSKCTQTLDGPGYVKKIYTLISNQHHTRKSEVSETHDSEAKALSSFNQINHYIKKNLFRIIITFQTKRWVTFAFFHQRP